MQELTYGKLPSFQDFSDAFDKHCLGGFFRIRGMKLLDAIYPNGNVDLNKETLWGMLEQCARDWTDNHELGDFASGVLTVLGFNWV
jgi:hypothetical protein